MYKLDFHFLQKEMAQSIPSMPVNPPCYLVSPGGGEFVRKPLPGGEAFINISLKNMPPYR